MTSISEGQFFSNRQLCTASLESERTSAIACSVSVIFLFVPAQYDLKILFKTPNSLKSILFYDNI